MFKIIPIPLSLPQDKSKDTKYIKMMSILLLQRLRHKVSETTKCKIWKIIEFKDVKVQLSL
jgi:hypothetical protein